MKIVFRTKKIAIIIASVTVVFVLLYASAVYLFLKQSRVVTVLREELEGYYENDMKLDSVKQALTDAESDLGKIDSYFVGSGGVVDFIEYLESLGERSGVRVLVDSVTIVPSDDALAETLVLRISTAGSWNGVARLLWLIESMPYKITFTQAGISADVDQSLLEGASRGASRWTGNFELSVAKLK